MNLSLNNLAEVYATRAVGPVTEKGKEFHRSVYNFKATAFNVATAVLITSVAVALFNVFNLYALFAAALSGLTRHATLANLKNSEFHEANGADKAICKVYEFILYLRRTPAPAAAMTANPLKPAGSA